jgi:Bacterial signalling protein N terminal repeat
MAGPVRTKKPQAPERATGEFLHLLLGPIIWLLHFTAIYATQSTLCALVWAVRLVPLAIIIATILAMVMLAVPAMRRKDRGDRHPSLQFISKAKRVLWLLSAVAIVWGCFSALLLHPCAPLR